MTIIEESLWILFIALFLSRVPVIGLYFRVINIAIHEFWHAATALITGGDAQRIELNRDVSGTAWTSSSRWGGRVFTSFMGYPGAAVTSFVLFGFIYAEQYIFVVATTSFIVLVLLLLWTRNLFGIVWSFLFLAINGSLLYFQNDATIIIMAYIIASIVLAESVYTSYIIMRLSWKRPKFAGDATNLRQYTRIPSFIWGALFFCISTIIAALTVLFFITETLPLTLFY